MGKKKKIKKDPLAGDIGDTGDTEIKLEYPIKTENPLGSDDEVCEEDPTKDAIMLEVMHIAAAEYSEEEDEDRPKKAKIKREIDPSKLTYHCTQCSSSFSSKVALKSHVWQEHTREYGEYPCDHCEKRFKTEAIRRRHMKIHTGNYHKCDICRKKFTTRTILKRHLDTVHADGKDAKREKKIRVCPHCDKGFNTKHGYLKHMTIHSEDRPFECPNCPQRFKNKSALDKHRLVHEKKFSCPICNKRFSCRWSLSKHSGKHLEKTLNCPYCVRYFATNENLRIHCGKHHPGLPHELRDGPVVCTVCNEIYENLEVLKLHVKIHPVVRKYECELCSMRFFTKNSMIKHIKHIHLKVPVKRKIPDVKETFPCSLCGKIYMGLRAFKRHKCDTDERPYKCPTCSKAFKRKGTLEEHQAVHNEKRTMYPCSDCDQKFNWKSGLRRHLLKYHGKVLQSGTRKPPTKKKEKKSKDKGEKVDKVKKMKIKLEPEDCL